METTSMRNEHHRNHSPVYSEDTISETEKEQLLGFLPSSDSPWKPSKSRLSRLRCVVALLFLSNAALLAAVLFLRKSNQLAPQKSWMPPDITRKQTFEFQPLYGEPPSDEVDAAWNALMPNGRGFVIIKNDTTLPDLPRLNLSIVEQRAVVSVFHQLHCLWIIRTAYFGVRAGNLDLMDPNHLRHCWDFLRQAIMCSADTTLEWLPAPPFNNGSTGWGYQHTCRNFDAIFTWAEDNRIKNSSGIH